MKKELEFVEGFRAYYLHRLQIVEFDATVPVWYQPYWRWP
jgi:hypothetical protein